MTRDFEYMSYNDADRIAILESRAAELERRLLAALPPDGTSAWHNVATPPGAAGGPADAPAPPEAYHTGAYPVQELPEAEAGPYSDEADDYAGDDEPGAADGHSDGGTADPGGDADSPGGRTEALINHGRSRAKPARSRRILRHWRMIAVGAVALLAGLITVLVVVGGGSPGWPASVATVQAQVKQACENPDVAAEPSGLNFACDKDTQQVLWVFSLLTSGNNPDYASIKTGRQGLEPITPAQGGEVAWSLNLHHPYNPANPIDSLEVAARAINNIIGGATLTAANGKPVVQSGLESVSANCALYTGSGAVTSRHGFPDRCAKPIRSAAGLGHLVADVFQRWVVGAPPRAAQDAAVLFQNANNPGDPSVRAILRSLQSKLPA